MAWLRKGDNAATHPLVMALATVRGADDRLLNEAYGFVQRCAEQSAGHLTDGVIDQGTAMLMGGPRWKPLIKACVEAGLLRQRGTGKDVVYLIPDDADFIHIRKKAEIEWERQRSRDNSNPDLTVPVRLRDGDGCRYCGRIVNWKQRRGRRGGTYDHLKPKKKDTTVDELVVACGGCNSTLLDDPLADRAHLLKPAPHKPYYGPETVTFLANHGEEIQQTERPDLQSDTARPTRPGTQLDTATPATTQPDGHRAPDEDVRPDELDTAASTAATRPGSPRTPWERAANSDTAAPPFATRGTGQRTPAERPSATDTASLEGHETAKPAGPARSSQVGGLRPGSGRDGQVRAESGVSPPSSPASTKNKRARRGNRSS